MRISELNIVEFGGIKNMRLSLDGGLNIISGDNEAGKSTVLLFIKFMLYGLARKSAKNSDRERALSWDGHRAVGTMRIEADGKSYLLERSLGATPRSDTHKITCIDTGESIDGEAGEIFLGVPAEVFESSCGIAQMKTAEISRSGAASAIDNMLVSSDESVDVEKILKKLDDVRKEYKLNRGEGGILYETDMELSRLRQKQKDTTERYLVLGEKTEKLGRSESKLSELGEACEHSEKILREYRYAEILQRFDKLDAAIAEYGARKNELAEFEGRYAVNGRVPDESCAAELKNSCLSYRRANEKYELRKRQLAELAEVDSDTVNKAELGERIEERGGIVAVTADIRTADKKAHSKLKTGILSLAAGAVCAAVGAVLYKAIFALLGLASAAVLLVAAGIVMLVLSRKDTRKRDGMCAEYGKSFAELEGYFEECLTALAVKRTASRELSEAQMRVDMSANDVREAEEQLITLIGRTADAASCEPDALCTLAEGEADRILDVCGKYRALANETKVLYKHSEALKAELSGYDRSELEAAVTVDFKSVTPRLIADAERNDKYNKEAHAVLDKEVHALRESIAALRAGISQSPVELADSIRALEQKYAENTEYYNALMLAKKSIEEASLSMSGNVTPALSNKAGELMALVSEGAYTSVRTTKALSLSVDRDGLPVSADMLSGGTRDAAYLCLRIALMLRVFDGKLPPLLMDETLCQLDDKRAAGVLKMLSKLADNMQCVLFTCHTREVLLCEEMNIKYNGIKL